MSITDTSGDHRTRPEKPERADSARLLDHDGRSTIIQWEVSGFDPGPGGASGSPDPPSRPDVGFDPGVVTPPEPSPPGSRPCTRWVIWEVWFTMRDERVCPECGPLHGQRFQAGSGPQPPLHTNCRCFRLEVDRECVSRSAGSAGAGTNY